VQESELCFAVLYPSTSATDGISKKDVLVDGTNGIDASLQIFTNLLWMFFTGRDAFRELHDQILKNAYRGSIKHEDIVSIKFVRPDVAIVETLQSITGYQKLLPGTSVDAKGRLRTRLLQVLVKNEGEWRIAAYHNVDVKSGVFVPEPQ
jgi:uncharacterized protein (TIGR02246 family)